MQVRLLGPVDVVVDDVPRPVRGLRRKAVLAVLALYCGEIVSTDRLIEAVWAADAPSTAVNTLQRHVSHLRGVLGSKAAILARPPGYLLDLGGTGTDVRVAEALIGQAGQSADLTGRVRDLRAALALWRGRPLTDVAALPALAEQAQHLDQLRLRGERALIDARLALGEHAQLVPDLERLGQDHPFDEQIHGQLMLALYRAGRQADALAAYRQLRRALNDELGIDPGQALRDLEAGMLRQDPALQVSSPPITLPPAAAAALVPTPVPAQLPPSVAAFAGRGRELADLDALLPGRAAAGSPGADAVVISAVSGTAGVGKTALAVHWAHRIAGRFPDGQLYVNLRGFDPGGSVVDPAAAVRGFLDAFGVPAQRIPAGLDARAGLFRSLLAGRRVLVVLDNARDVEQVRPLLPGAPGCMAVVTSRSQLLPLVAAEGARPLSLDVLTADEARDLLAGRLGADRVAAEPDAANEIIARCARLPLALAITAARGATHAEFPLATLASELRDAAAGLDAFAAGDAATDVRTVFSWSYQALSSDAARLFRLLGLHSGPDIALPAAASLTGLPHRQAGDLLAELTRAHLLAEHAPGRYAFHDLLRAYAAEQAHARDSSQQRHAAVGRILDHYLHTAHRAALLLFPQRDSFSLDPPRPGVIAERLPSHDLALAWFTAEYRVLLAAIEQAAAAGLDARAWQLAWTLTTFLLRRGHWHELVAVQRTALDAARRLGDRAGQRYVLRSLARACLQLGRLDEAEAHYLQVLDVSAPLDHTAGDAHAYLGLVTVAEQRGDLAEALGYAQRALEEYHAAGHQLGQASALNAVGWFHAQLGDYRQAVAHCQQALPLHQELGYRDGEAGTWDTLGYAHRGVADFAQATVCYQRAVDLYRELGDRYNEADVLASLGDTRHAAGDPADARKAWGEALAILDQLAHPDADQVRAKLRPPPQPADPRQPPGQGS